MPVPEVEEVGSLNGRQPEVAGSQRPIPDVEQTSEAKAAAANGCRAGPHTAQQIPEDVIVIADDDDSEESDDDGSGYGDGDSDDPSYHGSSNADSDEEGCESDATSRKVPDAPQHARRMHFTRYNSDNPSAVPPQTAEDSDDDCQVISEMPPRQQRAGSAAAKAFPSHITVDEDTGRADAQDCSASDSDSDCEIVDASQPEFRRQWEEAALRRRMSSVLKSEASNVGRGPTTDFRSDSPVSSRDRGGASPHPSSGVRERHSFRHAQTRAESVATSTDTDVGKTCKEHLSAEGQKGNHSKWDGAGPSYVRDGMGDKPRAAEAVTPTEAASTSCQAGDVIEEDLCSYPAAAAAATDDVKPYAPAGAALSGQSREPVVDMRFDACGHESELPDFHAQSELLQQELPMPPGEAVVDREKMKETDEFRQADDAEWARRNIELQRQSSEAQKLKKRKRAEADRKLEVETRQRQRLEEIRQFQQQEEVKLGLKDELRGQIRGRLESLAKGCPDMATLLRRLNVPVEGGLSPTPNQVGASYKRALLKFHPDRVSAPINGDPRNQVEAEETFKLISRLKNTLPLVSRPALPHRYFSSF